MNPAKNAHLPSSPTSSTSSSQEASASLDTASSAAAARGARSVPTKCDVLTTDAACMTRTPFPAATLRAAGYAVRGVGAQSASVESGLSQRVVAQSCSLPSSLAPAAAHKHADKRVRQTRLR